MGNAKYRAPIYSINEECNNIPFYEYWFVERQSDFESNLYDIV